jgi:hypothetical protein
VGRSLRVLVRLFHFFRDPFSRSQTLSHSDLIWPEMLRWINSSYRVQLSRCPSKQGGTSLYIYIYKRDKKKWAVGSRVKGGHLNVIWPLIWPEIPEDTWDTGIPGIPGIPGILGIPLGYQGYRDTGDTRDTWDTLGYQDTRILGIPGIPGIPGILGIPWDTKILGILGNGVKRRYGDTDIYKLGHTPIYI